jgi:multidrug efflux pump subunit AcrA (membrane-fusion protein)
VNFIYEVPNRDGRFRIGEHLTVLIESKHADNAVAIPDSAIVEEGGQPVAFIQVGGETFQKRELSLGLREGNFIQVLRGIQAGERVVTEGAFAIRLASVSTVIPAHGHVH